MKLSSAFIAFSATQWILLLVLVALHVAGVAAACWRHRENLVAAMMHGRKRPPCGADK